MVNKLVVSNDGVKIESFTDEELRQRQADHAAQEEQTVIDSLVPTDEEVAQAEFELKTITLLSEVGLL